MKKVTLKDIKGSWSDIITRLEQNNSKIAHFLEDVQVHSFDGEQIVIDLINGHRFHLKTLEKDAKLVEKEMYDILGQEIKLKFRLQDGFKEKKVEAEEEESEWIIEGLIKKNAINIMQFSHDDWCNKLKDMSKECTCNPDISVSEVKTQA